MKAKFFPAIFAAFTLASGLAAACGTEDQGAPHPNGGGWVASTAQVDSDVYVGPRASVCGNAKVSGLATTVSDHAQVFGNAVVRGGSNILDDAQVYGNAKVIDSLVLGEVYGNARVLDDAQVSGRAKVYGNAKVAGINTYVSEYAEVFGDAVVRGSVIRAYGKVNCGRWIGVKVFDDQTKLASAERMAKKHGRIMARTQTAVPKTSAMN